MRKELIASDLFSHLSRFYAATCTIRTYAAENPDTYGQPQPVWADFAGHVNIDCVIAPSGGKEVKLSDMTIAISTHKISLVGDYSATIIPKMRAVIGTQTYEILTVEVDSRQETTRLMVEVVN